MIVGTGVDIVEIDRFSRAVGKWGLGFLGKIFTENEIAYSEKKRFAHQHFAARFAAKESVFKAFGGDRGSIRKWTDIEIMNDSNGKPEVILHASAMDLCRARGVGKVVVSMAHSKYYAVANAILISENERKK
ncbi:MAG: holo-ACP synthase [Candidatus Omnitrophota bacterium]